MRECSFFHNFQTKFYSELKVKVDEMWFNKFSDNYLEFKQTPQFEKSGFAVLKSYNHNFYMRKTYMIIGRKSQPYNQKFDWEVDINLENNTKVSKQHALIIYNFEKANFEAVCLSHKNPIKVNDRVVGMSDKPCTIYDESRIEVGGETFHFLLPQITAI
jgi:hypothetical protein